MEETLEQRVKKLETIIYGFHLNVTQNKSISKANNIINIVSEVTDISHLNITGKCRKREYVEARWMAINMIATLLNPILTLKEIGLIFGLRDHSTIVYAKKMHEDMYAIKDKKYIELFEKCCAIYYDRKVEPEPIINAS